MAVTTKITVFWDVKPCSLVDMNQCFGETCCLDPITWRWKQQDLGLLNKHTNQVLQTQLLVKPITLLSICTYF